jgi:coenzyme F420-reducing hydrogenase beta subunit
MVEDGEGFRYPRIDSDACTACGACEDVCPALSPPVAGTREPQVFAARVLDEGVRRASSSGGVFSALAHDTLRRGGVVFGAQLDASLELAHVGVTDPAALAPLRGSKYLPSAVGECFREVRRHLDAGTPVLFVGTPCQVGGLRALLGPSPRGLVAVDLVCHGVPSLRWFRSYRGWLERTHTSPLAAMRFRDKRAGWKDYEVVASFADGSEYRRVFRDDPFMRAFLWNCCLRPACHECRWSRIPRVGDLTLGDYWGIRAVRPELDDDRGTSAVLVGSDEGARALARVAADLELAPTSLAPAVAANSCLVAPVPASPRRTAFMRDMAELPLEAVADRHLRSRYSLPERGVRLARRVFYGVAARLRGRRGE